MKKKCCNAANCNDCSCISKNKKNANQIEPILFGGSKKGDKMFEEDFFEVEELQFEARNGIEPEYEFMVDVKKYFRSLK